MSEQTGAAYRLWTPQGFREDEWTHAESAEALSQQMYTFLAGGYLRAEPAPPRKARLPRGGI